MNRVLEKVFPAYSRHATARSYYSAPEGSTRASVQFRVQYAGTNAIPDGRVVLFFAPAAVPEPRLEAFELEDLRPLFAKDVQNVQPGDVIEFESSEFSRPDALGFVPADLSNFQSELFVQALVNLNLSDPDANTCAGNWFSLPTQVHFAPPTAAGARVVVNVVAGQVVEDEMELADTEWIEHITLKSELLSAYHGKDVHITASVVLPKGYQDLRQQQSQQQRERQEGVYPTVFYIEGFGGCRTHAARAEAFVASEMGADWRAGKWPVPMFRVTLGSRFKFGHTSFADSAVNGPWGTALVQEFIPYFERMYPSAVSAARGRFLHGHSSGGWSTLWLQLHFPSFFSGAWSSAPDPVDFAHFQVANIYESDNMYWDPYGRPIPTYRCDGQVVCSARDENQLERVYGRGNGGQWDAFSAVFSPRDPATGMPVPLFDKVTGEIDRAVAAFWERSDIVRWLRARPELLTGGALHGKLHVVCGSEDNYYLNDACRSLQQLLTSTVEVTAASVAGTVAPAVPNYVALVPGDHSSIRTRAHYQQVYDEIARVYMSSASALGHQQ